MIPEWLVALTVTLLVVDLFYESEILSWIAMLTLTTYFTLKIDPSLNWLILTYLLILSIIALFYYTLYRMLVVKAVQKTLLRHAPDEKIDEIVGQHVRVRIINNMTMIKWDDTLWNITNAETDTFADGDKVIVTAFKDGLATIKKC